MDWGHFFDLILRSVASLIALFFLTNMLGKKQVSQLSAFDYVIGISMGSIAAEMTINKEAPFFDGVIAMAAYAFIAYLVSYLTLKSIRLRRFFTGVPVILIQDGKFIKKNLKKCLLDVNDLLEEARSNGHFDISEVAYAIMETSGNVSFLPKTPNRPVTMVDMKLKDKVAGLSANVIMDGNIMEENLRLMKKEKKWLLKEIKKQGYNNPEDIFLATLDNNYNLAIYVDHDDIEVKNVLE